MLGLLPVVTSYEERKRPSRLSARVSRLTVRSSSRPMTAHEFHYSTIVSEGEADRLFRVRDALGTDLGDGRPAPRPDVAGSYMHLIDLAGDGCMSAPIVHGGGITAAAAVFRRKAGGLARSFDRHQSHSGRAAGDSRLQPGIGCRTSIWWIAARAAARDLLSQRRYPAAACSGHAIGHPASAAAGRAGQAGGDRFADLRRICQQAFQSCRLHRGHGRWHRRHR